jgi:6-pyruvoyltetrahydropterin/6-carboxytetrahydropterin synthase
MKFEVSQRFFFDAAHTLKREIDTASSARIHGHTYHAEVTVSGSPDASGMVVDLGVLRRDLESVRAELDHQLLDEVQALGAPTLENLCSFIARRVQLHFPSLSSVRVWRESMGDACLLSLPPQVQEQAQ